MIINLVGFFVSKKLHQKCTKPRFYIVAKVSPDSLATMLQNSSLASKTVIVVKEMAILFATLSFLQDFIIFGTVVFVERLKRKSNDQQYETIPSDPCCNCLWYGNARSAESYGNSFSKVAYFGQIFRKTARKFLFFHKIHIFAKKSKGIYYI